MDQLIRYRLLAAELSSGELKLFCSKLIDNGQHELIISSMFNNLYKQIKQNKDLSTVQTINESIENIIQQRTMNSNVLNKSKSKSKPKPITIKSLSSSIINEIGSYLRLKELVKMEKVNRMFFVSLRYPYAALQKISSSGYGKIHNYNWMSEYCKSQLVHQMPLDFKQFKSMTKLVIMSDEMIKYKIHKLGPIFNKIHHLTVFSRSYGTYDQILNSNICNFSSIKQLFLVSKINTQLFSEISYLKMLLMSKQLNVLRLGIDCDDKTANKIKNNINTKEIQQKLSKLEVFMVRNSRLELYKPILDIISNQILSLHIDNVNALINIKCDTKYIGFPNLKEFCFKGTINNVTIAINELMKSPKHLQKVAIEFGSDNQRMNNNEQTNFKKAMNEILSINSLRVIRLDLRLRDNNFLQSNIINILENAIMNSTVNNKNQLEIFIFGMNNTNPLSNWLLSFIKTIRLWRQNFTFVFQSYEILTDEIKTKLSKIATISEMETEYVIWNITNSTLFDYKEKPCSCFCSTSEWSDYCSIHI